MLSAGKDPQHQTTAHKDDKQPTAPIAHLNSGTIAELPADLPAITVTDPEALFTLAMTELNAPVSPQTCLNALPHFVAALQQQAKKDDGAKHGVAKLPELRQRVLAAITAYEEQAFDFDVHAQADSDVMLENIQTCRVALDMKANEYFMLGTQWVRRSIPIQIQLLHLPAAMHEDDAARDGWIALTMFKQAGRYINLALLRVANEGAGAKEVAKNEQQLQHDVFMLGQEVCEQGAQLIHTLVKQETSQKSSSASPTAPATIAALPATPASVAPHTEFTLDAKIKGICSVIADSISWLEKAAIPEAISYLVALARRLQLLLILSHNNHQQGINSLAQLIDGMRQKFSSEACYLLTHALIDYAKDAQKSHASFSAEDRLLITYLVFAGGWLGAAQKQLAKEQKSAVAAQSTSKAQQAIGDLWVQAAHSILDVAGINLTQPSFIPASIDNSRLEKGLIRLTWAYKSNPDAVFRNALMRPLARIQIALLNRSDPSASPTKDAAKTQALDAQQIFDQEIFYALKLTTREVLTFTENLLTNAKNSRCSSLIVAILHHIASQWGDRDQFSKVDWRPSQISTACKQLEKQVYNSFPGDAANSTQPKSATASKSANVVAANFASLKQADANQAFILCASFMTDMAEQPAPCPTLSDILSTLASHANHTSLLNYTLLLLWFTWQLREIANTVMAQAVPVTVAVATPSATAAMPASSQKDAAGTVANAAASDAAQAKQAPSKAANNGYSMQLQRQFCAAFIALSYHQAELPPHLKEQFFNNPAYKDTVRELLQGFAGTADPTLAAKLFKNATDGDTSLGQYVCQGSRFWSRNPLHKTVADLRSQVEAKAKQQQEEAAKRASASKPSSSTASVTTLLTNAQQTTGAKDAAAPAAAAASTPAVAATKQVAAGSKTPAQLMPLQWIDSSKAKGRNIAGGIQEANPSHEAVISSLSTNGLNLS